MAATKTRKAATASNDQHITTLLAIAALNRAITVLEKSLPGGKAKPRLEAGSYPIALDIDIAGDIVKAERAETAERQTPDFKPDDLLAGMCVGKTEEEVEELVGRAAGALRDARQTKAGAAGLASAAEMIERTIEAVAKKRRMWRITPAGTREGAVTGSPSVHVAGTVGVNGADVDVVIDVDGVELAA